MKSMKFSRVLFIMLFSSFLVEGQSNKLVIDKIVGKVDNYIVLKSDVEKAYLDALSQGRSADKCLVLESLMVSKMLVAKAEIDSVEVSDDEVDNNLDRRLQFFISQVGSEEAIEEYYGKTLEQFKIELAETIKEQLTAQKMEGELTAEMSVSPAEVRKFFRNIPNDSLPYFSTEVKVGQIVKIPEVSKSQKDLVRKRLNDIRRQISDGADFNEMAKDNSMDPSVVQNGGELGFQRRGVLAPEYEATAFKLKAGEISEPFETDFGIHILQLLERRGNTFNTRHILISPQPLETDILGAVDYLDSLRSGILTDTITFAKAAKEYSDDQQTSSNGGFFSDGDGASRISVEELDPVIFFTLDTMALGTITKPMRYRLDDGTEAVRILFYDEKLAPHQANLRDDYQKIGRAALAEKRGRTMENWFLKARDDVYIEVDEEYQYCKIMNRIN